MRLDQRPPTTFQNRRSDKVTFRDNSIENTFDTGNRHLLRHHRRMDALLNALRRPFANTEQLDLISNSPAYSMSSAAYDGCLQCERRRNRLRKCNAGQYCELMRSVDTIDIEARIGFRVANLGLPTTRHRMNGRSCIVVRSIAGTIKIPCSAESVPAKPSRNAFMTGIPPATAASWLAPRRLFRCDRSGTVLSDQRFVCRHDVTPTLLPLRAFFAGPSSRRSTQQRHRRWHSSPYRPDHRTTQF